jgi:uncharacterized membrane-anchored protein
MKLKLFIVVLALQTAWLTGIAVVKESVMVNGSVIQLETERVDPRDFLRGDYLVLNYKINNVAPNLFSPPVTTNLPPGAIVFVAIASGADQFYQVTRASTKWFKPAANEIMLQGRASQAWWSPSNGVHLDYGIERFYVAEGTGTGHPTGKLTVQAVVSPSGHAIIKQVFVDGQPYAEAMKSAAMK